MIQTGPISHLTLTVSNLERAYQFYTDVLGFKKIMDLGERRILLVNGGGLIMAIGLPWEDSRALPDDRFNECRVGLDHLSFSAGSRTDLEDAVSYLDSLGVSHGEIRDLGDALRMYVLAFRDPDNIQLELTAPYA